jgi:tRNA threonylcarbamoyladenosine biosynthesis protein TsaB
MPTLALSYWKRMTAENKPKILAIETSTEVCSVALTYDDNVTELFETVQRQHAHVILTMIETLLAKFNLSLEQLDAIAFGCGPGSFTGLRVAASVVQALAFAAELPVIPVSSLQTCAQSAHSELAAEKVLLAVDARMQDIYWGAYRLDEQGLMQAIFPDTLCKPEAAKCPDESKDLSSLPQTRERARVRAPEEAPHWTAVGNAWEIYQKELSSSCSNCVDRIEPNIIPHAKDLLKLAIALLQQGKWLPAEEALPVYLRGANAWKKVSEQN